MSGLTDGLPSVPAVLCRHCLGDNVAETSFSVLLLTFPITELSRYAGSLAGILSVLNMGDPEMLCY